MKTYILLCLLVIGAFAQKELSLPVEPDTQKKLSISIKTLVDELQTFRTPKQNPLQLYNKVLEASKVIHDVRQQLGYNQNVVIGQGNIVKGARNILVGNYDSILGVNNFVLVDGYEGSVSGALLVEKWKIILDKKDWIKTNPSYAIFMINEQQNRKYQRYLNRNRGFSYGSNLNRNNVLLVQEAEDDIKNEIAAGLAALQKPELLNMLAPNGLTNILPKDLQKNYPTPTPTPLPAPLVASQPVNSNGPKEQSYQVLPAKSNIPVTNQAPIQQQPSNPIYYENSYQNIPAASEPIRVQQNTLRQTPINQIETYEIPKYKNQQPSPKVAVGSNEAQYLPFVTQNAKYLNEKQQIQQKESKPLPKSNLRVDETPRQSASTPVYNVMNAQARNGLNQRYVRPTQNVQTVTQPKYTQASQELGNQVFPSMGPAFTHFRHLN